FPFLPGKGRFLRCPHRRILLSGYRQPLSFLPSLPESFPGASSNLHPRTFGIWRTHNSKVSERLRSEEHTSELQSRFDLVCRLLLAAPPPFTLFPYTTLFRSFPFLPGKGRFLRCPHRRILLSGYRQPLSFLPSLPESFPGASSNLHPRTFGIWRTHNSKVSERL